MTVEELQETLNYLSAEAGAFAIVAYLKQLADQVATLEWRLGNLARQYNALQEKHDHLVATLAQMGPA